MTTRAKLLERISHIDNDNYLEAILNYLEESEKTSVKLSVADKESIEKSEEQITNGSFLTQSELDTKVDQWFAK